MIINGLLAFYYISTMSICLHLVNEWAAVALRVIDQIL